MIGSVTTLLETKYRVLKSISILSAPNKTTYEEGETLDLTGLVVRATYNDGSETITNYTTSPAEGDVLSLQDTTITVYYTFLGVTKTASFSITVEEAERTITLSGSGSPSYCYVTINGTKYTSAGTYTVNKGDTIVCGVYGRSSTYYGAVTVDGTQVLKVTSMSTETYTYTVTEDVNISLSYTSTSSRRNGRITITTT